jgi:hypothetical protein
MLLSRSDRGPVRVPNPAGLNPTLTLVANSRGTELRAAKWEQRVSASGVPFAQDAIRKRLIATAVMTCCRRVPHRAISNFASQKHWPCMTVSASVETL